MARSARPPHDGHHSWETVFTHSALIAYPRTHASNPKALRPRAMYKPPVSITLFLARSCCPCKAAACSHACSQAYSACSAFFLAF
eukprot:7201037-Pyramimonas_sp.AAC.1